VERAIHELDRGTYVGCNLLCADAERAVVVHGADWLRVRPLPPGLHVLTNGDVNDENDRRLAHAIGWLSGRPYGNADDCLRALRELCSQCGADGPAICLRGEERGTVSSTLVALRKSLADSVYLHSQGPPDQTPYEDYSALLRQLATKQP
jgi:hypothetical protein